MNETMEALSVEKKKEKFENIMKLIGDRLSKIRLRLL